MQSSRSVQTCAPAVLAPARHTNSLPLPSHFALLLFALRPKKLVAAFSDDVVMQFASVLRNGAEC